MEPVLEGLLGAGLLSATLAYLLSVLREWRIWKRELKGLLTLIHIEVVHNHLMLESWKVPNSHFLLNPVVTPVSTDAWKDSRVRLAQLLSLQHFTAVAGYYQDIQILLDLAYSDYSDDDRRDTLNDTAQHIREDYEEVKNVIDSHLRGSASRRVAYVSRNDSKAAQSLLEQPSTKSCQPTGGAS